MSRKLFWFAVILVFGGTVFDSVKADTFEPDFHIKFLTCKNAIGYLVLSDESLRIIEGDLTTMACEKRGKNVDCIFAFEDSQLGHKGNAVRYEVVIDSPPYLHFKTENGSEYVAVDTAQHAAVLTSRLLGQQFSGSKVCHGLYATEFEMQNLGNKP